MAHQTHPYANFLAGRPPLEVLAETPERLDSLVERIGPGGMEETYAPGKWPVRVIFCHLADCEIAFGYRWRQVAAQPGHVIQPFDQDLWATPYATLDGKTALDCFLAMRRFNLAWLKALPAEAFQHPTFHPERGEENLNILLGITAGHDLNHLEQLVQVAARAGQSS